MKKKDIASYTFQELEEEMKLSGEKGFRAKQIYEWIHVKMAESFGEMTNLSKTLREKLDREYEIALVRLVERQISSIDGTNKFLFELWDGSMIESVLMRYKHGNSICISSQVGCRMGCRFCASTIGGLVRNLTASEMLREVYEVQKITGERISNIVVMGTGEPLDNYDNFVRFIRMISDEHGLHISQRNITASTCGIVPNILRLAGENFQITLALSLHATNKEKRRRLMPVANKYDLSEKNFRRPDKKTALFFQNKLEKNGINVTIRREMGSDIDGACGQLRIKHRDNHKENENENIFND